MIHSVQYNYSTIISSMISQCKSLATEERVHIWVCFRLNIEQNRVSPELSSEQKDFDQIEKRVKEKSPEFDEPLSVFNTECNLIGKIIRRLVSKNISFSSLVDIHQNDIFEDVSNESQVSHWFRDFSSMSIPIHSNQVNRSSFSRYLLDQSQSFLTARRGCTHCT